MYIDSNLVEKLSKFTSILPSTYKISPVRKSTKDILVIRYSDEKYLLAEKESNKHINQYFMIWCLSFGMTLNSRKEVDEYLEICKKFYDYSGIYDIDFCPTYKSLTIHICTLQKTHDRYCIYLQLDNQKFSDGQLSTAIGYGRRFEAFDDAVSCAERIRNNIAEYSTEIEVDIIRDTAII